MHACDSFLSLTWPIITGRFSTDALSKLAQRLMLPEITRNIVHNVDLNFNVKYTNIIFRVKLGVKHLILTTDNRNIVPVWSMALWPSGTNSWIMKYTMRPPLHHSSLGLNMLSTYSDTQKLTCLGQTPRWSEWCWWGQKRRPGPWSLAAGGSGLSSSHSKSLRNKAHQYFTFEKGHVRVFRALFAIGACCV